jgi:hypothetical protein
VSLSLRPMRMFQRFDYQRGKVSVGTKRAVGSQRNPSMVGFAAIFSMVVKSHSDAAHITKRVVSRARP